MDSELFRDLLIAVGPSLVRCPNRFVPILVLPAYHAEPWRRSPLLHPWDVNILLTFAYLVLFLPLLPLLPIAGYRASIVEKYA